MHLAAGAPGDLLEPLKRPAGALQHDFGRAELAAELGLEFVPRREVDGPAKADRPQCRHAPKPQHASALHQHDFGRRQVRPQHRVQCASQRVGQHGRLIRQAIRHRHELAPVRHEEFAHRPARARVVADARPRRQAVPAHAAGTEVLAGPELAAAARPARRLNPASGAAQRWLHAHPPAHQRLVHRRPHALDGPDVLMSQHHRHGPERLQDGVRPLLLADERKVRPANAAKPRPHQGPVIAGQLGRRHLAQAKPAQPRQHAASPHAAQRHTGRIARGANLIY